MSIKSFDDAHNFMPSSKRTSAGILSSLKAIWTAFTDDVSYQCRYRELRADGLPHAAAAKKATKAAAHDRT